MALTDQSPPALYGADEAVEDLGGLLRSGHWPVAVYGLGKMGLPVAAVFAEVTGDVVGVDLDDAVVARVKRGESPVRGEPGLAPLVRDLVEARDLSATTDSASAAARSRIHVVLVPTTVAGRRPDLSQLRAVTGTIAEGLDPGDVVLVESTVPPGTCRDLVQPMLERSSGVDSSRFGVAFCPERTSSGRALEDIRRSYPKVVGGTDREATRLARRIYDEITENDVLDVADAQTAECVKLFEGVYRDVNIALANELATCAADLGIDVRAAIDVANTQPFCDIHEPGPGVGGHCIPFYPWFLLGETVRPMDLVRAARAVNEGMPDYTVEWCLDLLAARGLQPGDASALLLGVTYRPGVRETRMSPSIDVAAGLAAAGVETYAVDPLLNELPPMDAVPLALADVGDVDPDLIAVVTPHDAFRDIDWAAFERPIVVDCRDGLQREAIPHDVVTLGRSHHA